MSSAEEISTEHQDEFVNWSKTRQVDHLASVNHTDGPQPQIGSIAAAQIYAMSPAKRVRYHDRLHELLAQERERLLDNPPDDPAGLLQIFPHGYVEVGGERVALLPDGSLERPLALKEGDTVLAVYPPGSGVLGPHQIRMSNDGLVDHVVTGTGEYNQLGLAGSRTLSGIHEGYLNEPGPIGCHAPLVYAEAMVVDNADIQVTASGVARCGSEVTTWDERIIRCEKAAGHLKKHGFRIKWEDADV